MLRMRDVSSYNGVPDMGKIPAHIIAIKATEGTGYISPSFAADWKNARDHNKARIAYHYLHPSVSAKAQARFFIDTVAAKILLTGDMVAVDIEETDGLKADAVAKCGVEFVNTVNEELHGKCIVYTYINFADSGNCAGLGKSPLWIADPSSPAGSPRVPKPWSEWLMHQFGVRKGMDVDIVNMENAESLLHYGVLVSEPIPAADQRILYLSDGKSTMERVVNVHSLVAGFKLHVGETEFKVLAKSSGSNDKPAVAPESENPLPPE